MRPQRGIVVLAVIVAATARPAVAQLTEFNPNLFVLWSRTSNANVVDTGAGTDDSTSGADSYTNFGVELPLDRKFRFGDLRAVYSGIYTRYDQNSLYDNVAHAASVRLSPTLRSGALLEAEVFYRLDQDQGTPTRIDQDEQFLAVRTERRFYGVSFRITSDIRRTYWKVQAQGTRSEFQAIEGTLPELLPPDPQSIALIPQDRTFWSGDIEYRHKFSRRLQLGPKYGVGFVQFAGDRNEQFHVLSLATDWVVSKYFSFYATAGVFRRIPSGGEGVRVATETGFAWVLNLRLDPPLAAFQRGKIRLGLEVGISPSGGGSLLGTSVNNYVRLYLASGARSLSRWSWEFGTRYTRRDSTIEDFPTIQTAGLEGKVEYGIGSLVSLRLDAGWSKQLNVQADETNASFTTASLGVAIYPRGRIGTKDKPKR